MQSIQYTNGNTEYTDSENWKYIVVPVGGASQDTGASPVYEVVGLSDVNYPNHSPSPEHT